jgi:hypothetical protein
MATQFYLRDPAGNLLTIFQNLARAEYARAENKTGVMYLDFDPSSVETSLFSLDCRLEPWRQVGNNPPYLDGESVFFIRSWGWKINSAGVEVLRVTAYDANYLLDGAIVAYAAGSVQADQTDQADDMMKVVVRQNRGSTAVDTTRSLAAYLTVEADRSAAPSITKAFSRRNVMAVLQDIAAESFQAGTYLVFDTVYTSPSMLEFRTFTGQRGINHGRTSGDTVVISRERLNLEEPEYIESHADEFNYIYAGGQGTGSDRTICTAQNTASMGVSPFNRREAWVDARNTSVTASIQSEANAALQEKRMRRTLTGNIIDTEGCQDGVHYRYGDIVFAEYRGQGFDAHINFMRVVIENGQETRENQIRAEA